MTWERASLLIALCAAGCGSARDLLPAPPVVTSQLAAVQVKAVDAPSGEAQRFAIHPSGSLLEVFVQDLATGPHTLTFDRYHGSLVLEEHGAKGTLELDVDMRTVRTDSSTVASIVRDELLQAYRYPWAKIAASLRSTGASDERRAEGSVTLHGVKNGLRFTGWLRKTKRGHRLIAEFEMSRVAHGIRRNPDLDWMISDVFLVKVDLLATPEKVTVELGEAPPAR